MLPFSACFQILSRCFRSPLTFLFLLCLCVAPSALWGQGVTFTGSSPAVNFGSVNVCPKGQGSPTPCSQTETLTYEVASGTTIGNIGILTTGLPNLDYKAKSDDTSSTLCAAKTYATETKCTVDVTFAPAFLGPRNGGIVFKDGKGKVLANTYVYGKGLARSSFITISAISPSSFLIRSLPLWAPSKAIQRTLWWTLEAMFTPLIMLPKQSYTRSLRDVRPRVA